MPTRFGRNVVCIPSGDYDVIGRRTGYRDEKIALQERNGVPAPVVSIVYTELVESR